MATPAVYFELSPEEEPVLQEFRESVAPLLEEFEGQKLVTQAARNDIVLTRFLRARQLNVAKATEMFGNTLRWRKEQKIDEIAQERFPELGAFRRLVPAAFHRFDKFGRPVLLDWSGQLVGATLFKLATPERLMRLHINQMEFLYDRLFDLASANSDGKPIYQLVTVVDLEGLKKSHINKQAYAFLKQAARIDQDNYPELLARSLIVNPPLVFKFVWKLVRPFLDDRTKAKISVVRGKKSVNKEMALLINEEDLPPRYGGKCTCGHCFAAGADQELEYWAYTLGLDLGQAQTTVLESRAIAAKEAADLEKEKAKKKKRGFFGRRKKSSSEEEGAEGEEEGELDLEDGEDCGDLEGLEELGEEGTADDHKDQEHLLDEELAGMVIGSPSSGAGGSMPIQQQQQQQQQQP